MNDSARTPAPDFQDQLNALAEEMSDGLGRQAAIDRLVGLGLNEDDADDQEASIREQLRAIHRGTKAIFRDLENGLSRQQAVARFQELGLSRDEAVQALDAYHARKDAALDTTRTILEEMKKGLPRSEAAARFEELGLGGPTAAQFVGLRCDATAHWYGEQVRLGVLSALIGAVLLAVVLAAGAGLTAALLIPAGLLVYGTVVALYGWRKRVRHLAPAGAAWAGPGPFEVARRGHGRSQAIACAVESGVSSEEAAVLVHSALDGLVKIYRGFVILGVLAAAWGLLMLRDSFGPDLAALQRSAGATALVLWGTVGFVRGLIGWRRLNVSDNRARALRASTPCGTSAAPIPPPPARSSP